MLDKHRSVCIKGKVAKRTRRCITIVALDKQHKTRTVNIPRQYVLLEVKLTSAEEWIFTVPAWQAFQHKLAWEEA